MSPTTESLCKGFSEKLNVDSTSVALALDASSAPKLPSPAIVPFDDSSASIAMSAASFASLSPLPSSSSSATEASSPAWLLRRAVHSVDAQLPGSIWPPLRRALLDIVAIQTSWDDVDAAGAGRMAAPEPTKPRQVRFHQADGSHLQPPAWGNDPALESDEAQKRFAIVSKLSSAVAAQSEWLRFHSASPAAAAGGSSRSVARETRRKSGAAARLSHLTDLSASSPTAAALAAASSSGGCRDSTAASFFSRSPSDSSSEGAAAKPFALDPDAADLIGSLRSALFAARAEAECLLLSASFPPQQSPSQSALLSTAFPRSSDGPRGKGAGRARSRDSLGSAGKAGASVATPTQKAYAERERARARAAAAVLDSDLSGLTRGARTGGGSGERIHGVTLLSPLCVHSRRSQLRSPSLRVSLRILPYAPLSHVALRAGQPMMRPLLSSLLNSLIRQQLRRTLEQNRQRNRALVTDLPRGRGVGFLTKCDSAAKVLSCALYEAWQLGPLLREPTLRHLVTCDERDARDALAEMPQP